MKNYVKCSLLRTNLPKFSSFFFFLKRELPDLNQMFPYLTVSCYAFNFWNGHLFLWQNLNSNYVWMNSFPIFFSTLIINTRYHGKLLLNQIKLNEQVWPRLTTWHTHHQSNVSSAGLSAEGFCYCWCPTPLSLLVPPHLFFTCSISNKCNHS